MKPHRRVCLLTALVCTSLTFCMAQVESGSKTQEMNDGAQTETHFDPAKNETRVKLREMKVSSTPSEVLYLLFESTYPTQSLQNPPEDINIGIVAFSTKGFRFPDISALTIVANGKRLPLVPMLRFGKDRNSAEYAETMVSLMSFESFEKVSQSDTVEMRLYDTDFALNATHLQGIRELARLLYPAGLGGPKIERKGTARSQRTRRRGGAAERPWLHMLPGETSDMTTGMGSFAILTKTDEEARRGRQIERLTNEGKYDEAIQLAKSHLTLVEQMHGKEHAGVAIALNNIAVLNRRRGDYISAESDYKRAIGILVKARGPEDPHVAIMMDNLSLLYMEKGDIDRAQPLIEQALLIFVKTIGWQNAHVGMAINNLGSVYSKRFDFRNAETLYLEALEILENSLGKEHPSVAKVVDNLALLYGEHGFDHASLPLLERALKIFEKVHGPEHPDMSTPLNNLALRYIAGGHLERAEPLLVRAVAISEKFYGANHPGVATVLHNLAKAYAEGGQITKALTAETRVHDIGEHYLTLMLTTGSENQKRLYAGTLRSETNTTISMHLQLAPGNRQALELAFTTLLRRKGRVLDMMIEQYGALNRSHDPQDQSLRKQLSDARSRLSALMYKDTGTTDPARYRSVIASLEDEIERLETHASTRSTGLRVQTKALTLEQVQRAIPVDAALVELVFYTPTFPLKKKPPSEPREAPHYAAYVLHREGEPQWVALGKAEPIDNTAGQLRSALRSSLRTDVKQLSRLLDEKLMRPVRKLLGDKRRVFISPDGMLNLIPFGALVDEQNHYLVENYSINYLTSGRDLLRLQVPSVSRQGPLLIADPLFDANQQGQTAKAPPMNSIPPVNDLASAKFGQLPGTAEEVRSLSALLPGALVLTGARATEASLKQVGGPSILHVATHGFFFLDEPQVVAKSNGSGGLMKREIGQPRVAGNENPLLRSGLALAGANQLEGGNGEDGVLTALEASGLDLWGTKLVVLSACETGVGDVQNGEGVFGLRRALQLAGAESQVMSLWKVEDDATRDLMTDYYKRLQSGEGRTEALRQVQLKMLRNEGTNQDYRSPYFWAGFISLGDWRALNRPAP